MQTPVEVGLSNASQVMHRRKDATVQLKNLKLAGSRSKVTGLSSVDALTTMSRVPVAEPELLS